MLIRVLKHAGTAAAGSGSGQDGDTMYEMISYRDYIEMYDCENSKRVNGYRLRFALSAIYPDSILVEMGDFDKLSKKYIREMKKGERDVFRDAMRVISAGEELADLTVKGIMKVFLNWLSMNEYALPYYKRRKLQMRFSGAMPVTEEMDLEREMIQKICSMLPNWCRSLVIVLAGSGMRIGEAMRFEVRDVDLSVSPARVYLRANYTKNRKARMVLVTEEAKRELSAMIGGRVSGRVFDRRPQTFRHHWQRALDELGVPKSHFANRYMIHPHMLRKWFLSEFSLVASRDIAEMLAGHSGYLSDSYRRYPSKTVVSEFLKAEAAISVFPVVEKLDASAVFKTAEA